MRPPNWICPIRGLICATMTVAVFAGQLSSAIAYASEPDAAALLVFVASREGNQDIYTVREDASDLRRLTTDHADEYGPAWSPDGSRIAFWRAGIGGPFLLARQAPQLYVMSADGTDETVVWSATRMPHDHAINAPAWSPDGNRLVFESNENQEEGISLYTIRVDGTGLRRITHETKMLDTAPTWSPDGKRIYFQRQDWSGRYAEPTFQIFSVRPNGRDVTAITSDPTYHWGPKPSPDGTKILFTRGNKKLTWTRTFVMNADGSSMRRVGKTDQFEGGASWSPDGRRIVLNRDPDGFTGARGCVIRDGYTPECYYRLGPLPADIYVMNADGSDARFLIADAGAASFQP